MREAVPIMWRTDWRHIANIYLSNTIAPPLTPLSLWQTSNTSRVSSPWDMTQCVPRSHVHKQSHRLEHRVSHVYAFNNQSLFSVGVCLCLCLSYIGTQVDGNLHFVVCLCLGMFMFNLNKSGAADPKMRSLSLLVLCSFDLVAFSFREPQDWTRSSIIWANTPGQPPQACTTCMVCIVAFPSFVNRVRCLSLGNAVVCEPAYNYCIEQDQ